MSGPRRRPPPKHRRPQNAPSDRKPPPAKPATDGMRLNRFLSQAGVASRRKADGLIEAGQVRINGEVVTQLGTRLSAGDVVEVNGTRVTPQPFEYILLNKPSDTITTTDDERDRQTVLDLVNLDADLKASLFPVGRLDRHTTGVLLLTNDGDLAHRLMHPSYEVDKIYRVRTEASIKPHQIDELLRGVALDDGPAKADRVAYVDPSDHHQIALKIHEGRNRQVRRMLEALGHEVRTLERVSYGGLTTAGVRRGHWRRLDAHEVAKLRRRVRLR